MSYRPDFARHAKKKQAFSQFEACDMLALRDAEDMVMRALLLAGILFSSPALADPIRIVSWNMGPSLEERLADRRSEIQAMDAALKPDILVLVEVVGRRGAEQMADHLGWSQYHVAVSDLSVPITAAHEGIEVAVISKLPITVVTELDVVPDQRTHSVFGTYGSLAVTESLLTSSGIAGVDQTGDRDRGTLRVDFSNGLTIFPVHLKANSANACGRATTSRATLGVLGEPIPLALTNAIDHGFAAQVQEDKRNASLRERVAAAVKREADKAVAEGRHVVIAGDFNTSYELGKFGDALADCDLQPSACKKQPFQAQSCVGADGFDDTFAILTAPLVGKSAFSVLSRGLGRTYDDTAFGDASIDHIAVDAATSSRFSAPDLGCSGNGGETSAVARGCDLYGSDHYPISTIYQE